MLDHIEVGREKQLLILQRYGIAPPLLSRLLLGLINTRLVGSPAEAMHVVESSLHLLDDEKVEMTAHGQDIFTEGDFTEGLVFMRRGVALVSHYRCESDLTFSELVDSFSLLSFDLLEGRADFGSTVTALSKCEVQTLGGDTLQRIWGGYSNFRSFLMVVQAVRAREINERMLDSTPRSVRQRLAALYLGLLPRMEKFPSDVRVTQVLIGRMAMCAREVVNRTTLQFIDEGLIARESKGNLALLDEPGLRKIKQGEEDID